MKPKRRKLVRRSFMAVITGTSALALQACGEGDQAPAGNNGQQAEPASDSDS